MKKQVNKQVDTFSGYDIPTDFLEVLRFFKKFEEDHGPNLSLDFDPNESGSHFTIYKRREETDQEHQERLNQDEAAKNYRERLEREQYEKLKAKFG